MDVDLFGWVVIAVSAVVVGVSKTGMPGLGILPVPNDRLEIPSARLQRAERVEFENRHAAGQGFCDIAHELKLLGAR